MGRKGEKQAPSRIKADARNRRIAEILLVASLESPEIARKRFGCALASITKWQSELETNPQLQAKFNQLRNQWAPDLGSAIRESIKFCLEAAGKMDAKDPRCVEAITTSLEVLANIAMLKESLDRRYGQESEPQDNQSQAQESKGKQSQEDTSGTNYQPIELDDDDIEDLLLQGSPNEDDKGMN